MDHRPGKANKKTIENWRRLLEEAYRQSFYDVLDAIDDGVLTLAHAYTLNVQGGGGLAAIRARLQKLEEERTRKTEEGSFPDWLEDFLKLKPRIDASDDQYLKIGMAVRAFMAFLVERHELPDATEITRTLWTKDNLRAYITHYVETKHAAARERLEARWQLEEKTLTPTERSDLLRRDRGAKQVTANRHVNLIGAFSKWLLEHRRIDHDPARGNRLSVQRETRHRADDHRALSAAELAGFLRWSAVYDHENPCEPGERPDTLWWTWLVSSGATTYTEGVRLRSTDIHADEAEKDRHFKGPTGRMGGGHEG